MDIHTKANGEQRKFKQKSDWPLKGACLIGILLLLGMGSVFGALGENEEQCRKHYGSGETIQFDASSQTKRVRYSHWFSDDVEVEFSKGIAVEVWIKANSLTEAKLTAYLEQNSQGHKWTLTKQSGHDFGYNTSRWYNRDDGATVYWANYAAGDLVFKAP